MTTNFRLSLAALVVATGCGTEVDLGPEPETSLIAYNKAKDQVEGTFSQGDVTVHFTLVYLGTEIEHIAVTTDDGLPVVDSTFVKGVETSTILGLYHVDPITPLDRDALAELAAVPEIQLLPALDVALCPVVTIPPKKWRWATAHELERL